VRRKVIKFKLQKIRPERAKSPFYSYLSKEKDFHLNSLPVRILIFSYLLGSKAK